MAFKSIRSLGVGIAVTLLASALAPTGAQAGLTPLPFMKATDFTPYWPDQPAAQGATPTVVSAFRFLNQSNRTLTEQDMKGHVSLVNFFFTSCGSVCPRLMSQVQRVEKRLAHSHVRIYSFSVLPDEDSPKVLKAYAKARKLSLKNWDLITGDRAAIYQVGRGVFRADRNPDGTVSDSEFIHTQAIYLVDSELRVRGVYQSDKSTDMDQLVRDVAQLEGT